MQCDIAIIGGGAIGLACAWRLAQAGADVHLFERGEFGHQASWAAAGMLAAQCEAIHHPPVKTTSTPGESTQGESTPATAMLELCLQSRALYPAFAAELEAVSNIDIELSLAGHTARDWRQPGILYIGAPDGLVPNRVLQSGICAQQAEELTAAKATKHLGLNEEFAKPARYFWLPQEGQVENRRLIQALEMAARQAGSNLHAHSEIKSMETGKGRVTRLLTANEEIDCRRVLLCAGAWSTLTPGLPRECTPPVIPVAGQMLALRPEPCPQSTLYSENIYLVPRRDGRLLVGATMEDVGFNARATPEGARSLQQAAAALLPSLAACEIEAHWAGLRPGTPDNLPILGRTPLENLWVATGHFRNGILLAPVTAQLMTDCILNEIPVPAAFHLERFFRN